MQVVLAGTSKNYHEESGIEVANVHPAPLLHPSNVQVLYESIEMLDIQCSLHLHRLGQVSSHSRTKHTPDVTL